MKHDAIVGQGYVKESRPVDPASKKPATLNTDPCRTRRRGLGRAAHRLRALTGFTHPVFFADEY